MSINIPHITSLRNTKIHPSYHFFKLSVNLFKITNKMLVSRGEIMQNVREMILSYLHKKVEKKTPVSLSGVFHFINIKLKE